jgi:PAS domain S-box-containing protein
MPGSRSSKTLATSSQSTSEAVPENDEIYRLLVESVQDYAIFLLSPEGKVMTWNLGAKRIKGYEASEIIGQHFSRFYSSEAQESGWPQRELEIASAIGRFTDEGWRVRKDGTKFWASVVITAMRREDGELRGFSKVTRDLTERRELEERTQQLNKELRTRMAELTASRNQLELRSIELERLSSELVRVQDVERRRIARELHDDLGQQLVALKMNLDVSPAFPTRAETLENCETAIAKVRNISYLLHPPLLDESGLLAALHLYLEGLRKRSDLKLSFEYHPRVFPRLTPEMETTIFRVIQEAITNVHRHSRSPDARIEIRQDVDRVTIRVRDFGIGLSPSQLGGSGIATGAGIGGIRERVKQLGGNFKIISAEPGTLVEVMVPLV